MKDHVPMPLLRASTNPTAALIRIALPAKASELLALALAELRRVEQDSRYRIDMKKWHIPSMDRSVCSVCLAGAVLAGHLPPSEIVGDVDGRFDPETAVRLQAIDLLRCGAVKTAVRVLGQVSVGGNLPRNRYIPNYDESPELFRTCLAELLHELCDGGY